MTFTCNRVFVHCGIVIFNEVKGLILLPPLSFIPVDIGLYYAIKNTVPQVKDDFNTDIKGSGW